MAPRAHLDNIDWQTAEIQAALIEADAGDFASDAELAAVARKWEVNAV